jgi:CheY-like chemotaxis protein
MNPSQTRNARELGPEHRGIPRVIVAEDDAIFRALLCELLRDAGVSVCEVPNGVELLEILAQGAGSRDEANRLDLIVSDVCVPEYGSIELILGMHAAKMGIPLITITTLGERRTQQVLTPHPMAMTLAEESFDIDGFRELVLELLADRHALASMRVTFHPSSAPTLRPSGVIAVDSEVDAGASCTPCGNRATSTPPRIASMC